MYIKNTRDSSTKKESVCVREIRYRFGVFLLLLLLLWVWIMDIGAESSSPSSPSPETGVVGGGVVIDFPVSDKVSFSSPRRIPKNLQKRLLEAKTPTTSSVEEIEAKLRHAHLRRQVLYYYYNSTLSVSFQRERRLIINFFNWNSKTNFLLKIVLIIIIFSSFDWLP